jgi:4a-hydroxytetrahydrobiopterin dehydratase
MTDSIINTTTLINQHCQHTTQALSTHEIAHYLEHLSGWSLCKVGANQGIEKTYKFANYLETLLFVQHVGWIAHHEDHHPDISFGYNTCKVVFNTHSANGISINDMICAAKIDV